jgi:biotin transport system substrate-specific component
MQKSVAQRLSVSEQVAAVPRQLLIIVGASLLVAISARFSLPLPFTPIPLTMQNLAVLVVGLALGSRRGFAALALYLAQGAAGLPFFSGGAYGLAALLGPTGGYLLSYPLVAFVAGWIVERTAKDFRHALLASICAELVLFACGISYLVALTHVSWLQAASFGLYHFVFAEVMKVTAAAGIAQRLRRVKRIK